MASERGLAVLVLHHTKKMEAEDRLILFPERSAWPDALIPLSSLLEPHKGRHFTSEGATSRKPNTR